MDNSITVSQNPAPGTKLLRFRGDTETFTLSLSKKETGNAWVRTNIGHAGVIRNEIIREIADREPHLGRDWFDIPMEQVDKFLFKAVLPLCETGHFEAKCLFIKEGAAGPVWPEGDNITINVEPAHTCASNIIYNAFVRQFGYNKSGDGVKHLTPLLKEFDSAGYTVIPPSGTFRDLVKELDFIIGRLGCRIIQLLPVNPTPTTFGRMGRFGSPFAALSFTAVDSAQAEFDPKATPLEQFIELVDAVHERSAKIIIDIAVNHTGWGARLHETHPEWLVRGPEGHIEVPGAWGVRWEDLTRLDYTKKELWFHVANIFLTWCRRGVDGFRCDAGYMIPQPAWKYMIAIVREQYPETIFFLEGLGGRISVTRSLLNKAGFNWAYSELFQNYDRSEIEHYLPEAMKFSDEDGLMVHFAETHDNNRLAADSIVYAGMRTALCALSSHSGAFGFANGVEWYADEKINVHDSPSLNWGAVPNQVKHICRLTGILKKHPAFFDKTTTQMIQKGEGNFIVLLRHHIPSGKKLLVLANLDCKNKTRGSWNYMETGMNEPVFFDLITGKEISVSVSGMQHYFFLDPGQVLCLSPDMNDIKLISNNKSEKFVIPARITRQLMRAKALEVFLFYNKIEETRAFDPDAAARKLWRSPEEFCRALNNFSDESRVVTWQFPRDKTREVMIPHDHFFLICAIFPFRARIVQDSKVLAGEDSLTGADGKFFVLFSPLHAGKCHRKILLDLAVYEPGECEHVTAQLLLLARPENVGIKRYFNRKQVLDYSLSFLDTNGRGAMVRANSRWGELKSRYDALLAANINDKFPEDRRVMFTRCRAWLVFQGYSQDINKDCLDAFAFDYDSGGFWDFLVPSGQGEYVLLKICIKMLPKENAVRMLFYRCPGKGKEKLNDEKEVKLILRPDIEDRSFHETTKAYLGLENIFSASVKPNSKGFIFSGHQDRQINIRVARGSFVLEPEWEYMVHRPLDAQRALDPDSDLFSPGYFYTMLKGGEFEELTAQVADSAHIAAFKQKTASPSLQDVEKIFSSGFHEKTDMKIDEALLKAMDMFVVDRGKLKSIIAGYPWFLDWGRDSLIFLRGMIAAGRYEDSKSVLKLFGQYEENGTLPNMIHGDNAENRNTSDAPLWFFTACSELVEAENNESFLDSECGGRTIRKILLSIGRCIISETANRVKMDTESGLIFSPAHFTWMDTNHPACTPRQGYPIEIQALWYAALSFLCKIDPSKDKKDWKELKERVKSSILDFFIIKGEKHLADCLYAKAGEPASAAEPDDALRPNQLFAVTLGAVSDQGVCRGIVDSCRQLIVPGAIRSLADRPVRFPLEIIDHGKRLNDPYLPYQGKYKGDEDTKRKPAYHNGTAWTWVFPSFCEAWFKVYGKEGRKTALAWLLSSTTLMDKKCVGQIPEILDGDAPHKQRGCDAQAWGVSEFFRVLRLLITN